MLRSWQLIQLRHHQSEPGGPVTTFRRARLVCLNGLALGSQILCGPTDQIPRNKSGASPLIDCALYVGPELIHRLREAAKVVRARWLRARFGKYYASERARPRTQKPLIDTHLARVRSY